MTKKRLLFSFNFTNSEMRISLVVLAALLAVVVNCEFSIQDLPQQMLERLDRFIEIKQKWADMWMTMSDEMKVHYEKLLLARMDKLSEIQLIRIHEIVERIPAEYRHKLLEYMRQRFPAESGASVDHFDSELDEIDAIVSRLPKEVRDQIHSSLNIVRFEEAAAYAVKEVNVSELEMIKFYFTLHKY